MTEILTNWHYAARRFDEHCDKKDSSQFFRWPFWLPNFRREKIVTDYCAWIFDGLNMCDRFCNRQVSRKKLLDGALCNLRRINSDGFHQNSVTLPQDGLTNIVTKKFVTIFSDDLFDYQISVGKKLWWIIVIEFSTDSICVTDFATDRSVGRNCLMVHYKICDR